MAADARGAESGVDVGVDLARVTQSSQEAAAPQTAIVTSNGSATTFNGIHEISADQSVVEPEIVEHEATVIDLRTAEPIVEIERLTDSGLARASGLQLSVKRSVDVLVSVIALVLLAPIFFLVALAVKATSRGPVFFKQPRVGKRGELFDFVKFRSMRTTAVYEKPQLRELNEKDGPIFKIRNDPRITRVGRVIRKLSIDELPQLAHVLTGKMSLVGPRPHLPEEVAAYDARAYRRLTVKPGITCIWQVSGRADLDFETWIDLDLEYIDNWSLGLDTKLLVKTVPAVLSGKGAY